MVTPASFFFVGTHLASVQAYADTRDWDTRRRYTYTNVLGFEKRIDNPTPDGPRFLTVAVTDQDFELVLWPGAPGQGRPVYGRVSAAYTIEVRDCRKMFEALKSSGVKFDTDVLEYPWGSIAVFQDPVGNRLQLRQGR